jgi:hypothetical protein
MARIPILNDPAQLRTGNQTQQTANLPAVTNASIGKALGDVATVASNIQDMSRRANDVTYLTNASLRMNEAQKEFATFQQSPEGQDETQWLPKWKELESKLQGEIGSMPLTPNARAQLTNRFSEWSTNGTINVQSQAFKQTGRNAALSVQNALTVAQQTGDFSTVRQAASDYNSAIPSSPEEQEAMALQIDSSEKKYHAEDFQSKIRMARDDYDGAAMLDAIMTADKQGVLKPQEFNEYLDEAKRTEAMGTVRKMASIDPIIAKAKIKADTFPELTPDEKLKAESYADGVLRDFQQREVSSFADFVTNGGSANDFKFQWNLSDAKQAELREAGTVTAPLTEAQAASKRLELESRIGKYDMDKDPDRLEMLRISADLDAYKRAAPYMASDLAMSWGGKKGGEKGNIASMEIADNDDYIAKLYKPKMDALLESNGSIKTGKEAEFRKLQSEATEKKKLFRAQIGTDPTPEKARKASQNVLTMPVADEVANYFDMFNDTPQVITPINQARQELKP